MSTADQLNAEFQQLMQSFRNWPTSTIEKNNVIEMLEDFYHQNFDIHHIYDATSVSEIVHSSSDHQTDDYSQLDPIETSGNRSFTPHVDKHLPPPSASRDTHSVRKESNPMSPTNILIKEGDMTVRKGSTFLLPLLKKYGFKTSVYCELSYTHHKNEKLLYFNVYQNRKTRKLLHNFIIDDTCSFIYGNKREFQFKHNSSIEYFTTETGTADGWISAFNELSVQQADNVEEVYENPEELGFTTRSLPLEHVLDTPVRPPPRPPRSANSISPENIYVCLYDHHSTTDESFELEFSRGDLLYIINMEGPNFYIARRLTLPLNKHVQNPTGLVYKDYIKPAYEKFC